MQEITSSSECIKLKKKNLWSRWWMDWNYKVKGKQQQKNKKEWRKPTWTMGLQLKETISGLLEFQEKSGRKGIKLI